MKPILTAILFCFLAGCATPALRDNATDFAARHGFVPLLIPADGFTLFGLYKRGDAPMLHVYVEGDGHAWINRTTPSRDPTPHNPVALYLATSDPAKAHILYLARPCQYVQGGMCHRKYWTNARMGKAVIDSLNTAIDWAKKMSAAHKVCLVGFSGGGGCAALVAAKRNDVTFLGSVAGNLDVGAWVKRHKLTPLDQSLDPMTVAGRLGHIPQRHYAGTNDAVIPPELVQHFCIATGQRDACQSVPGIAHGGPWQKVWNYNYY